MHKRNDILRIIADEYRELNTTLRSAHSPSSRQALPMPGLARALAFAYGCTAPIAGDVGLAFP
jgi:hypothetical protein